MSRESQVGIQQAPDRNKGISRRTFLRRTGIVITTGGTVAAGFGFADFIQASFQHDAAQQEVAWENPNPPDKRVKQAEENVGHTKVLGQRLLERGLSAEATRVVEAPLFKEDTNILEARQKHEVARKKATDTLAPELKISSAIKFVGGAVTALVGGVMWASNPSEKDLSA